jgi:hypothetical protein
MEQSYNDTSFLTHNDEIVGLSLGYQSGVTEHECGIRGVMDRLGVEGWSPEKGMAGYALPAKWRDSPLHLVEGSRDGVDDEREPFTALVVAGDRAEAMRLAGSYAGRPRCWSNEEDKSLTAWWDDKGFVVFAWTDEAAAHLRGLFESVLTGSLALMAAKSSPFGGGGPILVRLDRAQDEWEALGEKRLEAHRDLEEWKTEWRKETDGLFGDLARMGKWVNRESGRNWDGFPAFACALYNDGNRYRKGWYSNPKAARTEDGKPMVLVNPDHQNLFPYGWFTAEDLRGWADGTGRMWPLCASLPEEGHPFWRWINGQLPEKPDNVYCGVSWDWEVSLNEPAKGLLQLEGVDEALAAKIVAERERGGEFTSYDDFKTRCPEFAERVLDDNEVHVTCLSQTWGYRLPNFPERDDRGDLTTYKSYKSKDLWGWAYEKFGFCSSDGGRHPAFHPVFREERSAGVEAGLSTHVVVYDLEKFDAMMKSWREIAEAYPEWGFDPHFWGRATERNMNLMQRIREGAQTTSE